jgi:hypothetical protein
MASFNKRLKSNCSKCLTFLDTWKIINIHDKIIQLKDVKMVDQIYLVGVVKYRWVDQRDVAVAFGDLQPF